MGTKDGATSDEMVDDISTGQYDGVSASGDASVRLMKRGDVSPVNTDLIPNFADVAEGLKNQDYNSQNGHPYGVPHGRGWNVLAWRSDVVKPAPDSWSVVWNANNPYKGKISIYDDSIFIADAAVYLKATQPDLGIDNPYQLNEEQFNAAVDLLKTLKPNVGEWWGDYAKQIQSYANKDVVVGTTWPYQVNILKADKKPVEMTKPKEGTTGWSDTWMIYSKAAHPNCMYLWMNYIISPQANAKVARVVRRGALEPEGVRLHDRQELLHGLPRKRRELLEGHLLLDDAHGRLRRAGRHLQDAAGLGERLDGDPRVEGESSPGRDSGLV